MLEMIPAEMRTRFLDLGAGNFRNSIWAVEKGGFAEAVGIEFSPSAIEIARRNITERKIAKQVTVVEQSLDEPFPYPDHYFSVVIEMMTMHALNPAARTAMMNEVKRVLQPGGYFIFFTISGSLEYEGEKTAYADLLENSPAEEPGSYKFERKGFWVVEKGFTQAELEELFTPMKILVHKEKVEFSKAFGDVNKRVYSFGVAQMPA